MALIIAGERSGVGKTTITLTLLAFLYERYNKVQSFKVGPDYIDPMFHKYVTKRACRNLDPILTSETYVKQCFTRHIEDVNYALVEGVMGLFDGVGQVTPFSKNGMGVGEQGCSGDKEEFFTKSSIPNSHIMLLRDAKTALPPDQLTPIFISFASTAHIAKLLNLPVVLVIDCSRLSGSVAAIVHGYCSFDTSIKIAGLILNRVGSDRHLSLLKNALEPLKIPIFGVLRRQDNIAIPDRHLGLIPTAELPQMDTLIERLVRLGETCFDWERLLPLLEVGKGERLMGRGAGSREQGEQETEDFVFDPLPITNYRSAETFDESSVESRSHRSQLPIPHSPIKIAFERSKLNATHAENTPRVAIAWDKAFNFYYQENFELLEELGAELVFWSPLQDTELPENIQGMYFGGGFPEVFASQLAANTNVLLSVKTAICSGIPTIAECGGLMYLCEQIIDFAGQFWSMVGVLPTTTVMDKRLSLGYRRAIALEDSILVSKGKMVCGHEFHRSHLRVSTEKPLWQTYRYDLEEFTGDEGWIVPANLHASYVHLHWGATPEIPQRFLEFCVNSMVI